jgi:hypothetical protein
MNGDELSHNNTRNPREAKTIYPQMTHQSFLVSSMPLWFSPEEPNPRSE